MPDNKHTAFTTAALADFLCQCTGCLNIIGCKSCDGDVAVDTVIIAENRYAGILGLLHCCDYRFLIDRTDAYRIRLCCNCGRKHIELCRRISRDCRGIISKIHAQILRCRFTAKFERTVILVDCRLVAHPDVVCASSVRCFVFGCRSALRRWGCLLTASAQNKDHAQGHNQRNNFSHLNSSCFLFYFAVYASTADHILYMAEFQIYFLGSIWPSILFLL